MSAGPQKDFPAEAHIPHDTVSFESLPSTGERGPAFAQFDPSLHKEFAIAERRKMTVGVEAYHLFNQPNFDVPSNTPSPFFLGGNGEAVFKDATGNFAANAGQVLTTAGTARQIQLMGRMTF